MKLGAFAAIGITGLILIGAGCAEIASSEPDLGFTMEETGLSGAWNVIMIGNTYRGSFEDDDTLTYFAIEPNTAATGKGATWSNVVGYRETKNGQFEYTFDGDAWDAFDDDSIEVIGETPLKNGEALVLGPTDCAPSPACYSGSGWFAIINTPNGVTPGGVFDSGKNATLDAFKEALERVAIDQSYRPALKAGNFTFSVPEGAVAVQTDAGGKSAISIYADKNLVYQAEGIIYSVLFYTALEFETGESYSFETWLKQQGVTLTGHTSTVGGSEFYEGHRGDADSVSLYHYVSATDDEAAYVIVLPSVRKSDAEGKYIQDSLDFSPTREELDAAQPLS